MSTESLGHLAAPRIAVEPPRRGADQKVPESMSIILLERIRLFHGLGRDDLGAVARAGQRREVPRGSYFFANGHGDTVYLLQSGCVTITQAASRSAPRFLRLVGPGELFGAMGQLQDQFRPASARALFRCRALSWNREAIRRLMKMYPVLALNALSELEDQLYEFQGRYQGRAEPAARWLSRQPIKPPFDRSAGYQRMAVATPSQG